MCPGLWRGPCARLAAVRAPRAIFMPGALGPAEPPSSDPPRRLRPKNGPRSAGVTPSLAPVPRELDIAPVEPPSEPRPLSSPAPRSAADFCAPPADPVGARPIGLLRFCHTIARQRYFTGADTIRNAFPAQAALAVDQDCSQPVSLWAVLPGGGGEREFPDTKLHYKGGNEAEWKLTKVVDLHRALGLVDQQDVEVWVLPGGRVYLRPVSLGAPQGSAADARAPHRRVDAVASFAAAELGEPGTPPQGRGGDVCLGSVRLTWNSKHFLAGPEVLEAAFPAAWAAAQADKQNHEVTLLASGFSRPYKVKVLGKTGHLSSITGPMQALGLADRDNGSSVELWRLANGQVEARRAEL